MITGPNANHNNLWKSYDLSQFITPYSSTQEQKIKNKNKITANPVA